MVRPSRRDLTGFWMANPPLKRWAIIGRPAGTGEEGRRQGREAQSRIVLNSDGVGVGIDDLSSSPKAVTCPRTPKSPIANRRCLGRKVAPLQGAGRFGDRQSGGIADSTPGYCLATLRVGLRDMS